jgi:hypothetical protein
VQGPAAAEAAETPAPAAAEDSGKKKDKKKDKKGAAGLVLGKGTAIVRTHLEKALAAAAAAAAGGAAGSTAAAGSTLGVTEGQLEGAAVLLGGGSGVEAVEGVITSHESAAVKMLEDVRVVVEANQARRKPKVR